MKLRKA